MVGNDFDRERYESHVRLFDDEMEDREDPDDDGPEGPGEAVETGGSAPA